VEAIDLDRDAGVSLDGLRLALEGEQARTAGDPELDRRECGNTFLLRLTGREEQPEQVRRTVGDVPEGSRRDGYRQPPQHVSDEEPEGGFHRQLFQLPPSHRLLLTHTSSSRGGPGSISGEGPSSGRRRSRSSGRRVVSRDRRDGGRSLRGDSDRVTL